MVAIYIAMYIGISFSQLHVSKYAPIAYEVTTCHWCYKIDFVCVSIVVL